MVQNLSLIVVLVQIFLFLDIMIKLKRSLMYFD